MFTPEEIAAAIKVIDKVAGSPDSGAIADLIKDIRNFDTKPTKEVRVVEAKETR
jgi:hypothetical protein